MVEFEIHGIIDVENRTKDGIKSIWDKAIKALGEEAKDVLVISQTRTPEKTGALKRSGQVTGPEIKSKEASFTISFGNESVHYAVPVHEQLRAKHLSGRSKFLESAVAEEESKMLGRINAKIHL